MRNIQATHARAQLLKLLDNVEAGESVTILRRGRAVAQLVPAQPQPNKQALAKTGRRKSRGFSDEEILAAANAIRSRP